MLAQEPASDRAGESHDADIKRQRKTRCDPGLPRCGPCERTNSTCEYYDASKGHNVNRNYVVYLQHRVRELEQELDRVENEDAGEDPEAMMRAATVRMHDAPDSKYLGPSSGIAITRLVMQLAKQFTDAKSIMDIVSEQRARQIKETYEQEQAKPTSKVYPLISDVAAEELPTRNLADMLVRLYKLKVQPMYPALHEPTLDRDIATVYHDGSAASPFQHFICRMVLAISLQKMDTQYAGLADSYYLAALKYLEPVVRPMDLKTLQCFALMAEYSMLTPTRTAIYYVVGMAVRLVQALGFHEEKTITRGRAEGTVDHLEVDMRRRLYWCILVMEFGLAHSLGRPAILATSHEHLDVGWFETCDDTYIRPEGVDPAAPRPTLKKWIAIHFFKMRLLQLEIRRKLYQRKRPEPQDDSHPWFRAMDAKLAAWRDASPNNDEGIGLDKVWFIGRYNTMIIFLYRPSPQVPRPSLDAAMKCFDACQYNIQMQREQIARKNVDLTWIFTQTIFSSINTMLWSLSYVEVRRKHSRANVEHLLNVAMDAISLASDRWPGVTSALQLYQNLIGAVLKIYEKDGDVPISTATPSDSAVSPGPAAIPDAFNRSLTTSPATASSTSVATPDERPGFGYIQRGSRRSLEEPPPVPYQSDAGARMYSTSPPPHVTSPPPVSSHSQTTPGAAPPVTSAQQHIQQAPPQPQQHMPFDPNSFNNPLPPWTPGFTAAAWNATPAPHYHQQTSTSHISSISSQEQPQILQQRQHQQHQQHQHQHIYGTTAPGGYHNPLPFAPNNQAYPFPGTFGPPIGTGMGMGGEQIVTQYWDMDSSAFGDGLTHDQQQELMHSLETDGMEDIQSMITQTISALTPKNAAPPAY